MATLYFKYGTMNSGKSAHLLMTNHNYAEQHKDTLIFKPSLDTRDGDIIHSRALGEKVAVNMINREFYNYMYEMAEKEQPHCVLVDEVQFMEEHQIEELAKIVDLLGIPVICYGLLTDFQGKLFVGSKKLIELGARLEEIKTVCWHCDVKASFNLRLHDGEPIFFGEQIQVGGNESYRPICRKCYLELKEESVKATYL